MERPYYVTFFIILISNLTKTIRKIESCIAMLLKNTGKNILNNILLIVNLI